MRFCGPVARSFVRAGVVSGGCRSAPHLMLRQTARLSPALAKLAGRTPTSFPRRALATLSSSSPSPLAAPASPSVSAPLGIAHRTAARNTAVRLLQASPRHRRAIMTVTDPNYRRNAPPAFVTQPGNALDHLGPGWTRVDSNGDTPAYAYFTKELERSQNDDREYRCAPPSLSLFSPLPRCSSSC